MKVLEFSEKEYSLRVNRAKKLMERKDLDALLVIGECSHPTQHFRYFTGYQSREGATNSNRPYTLILPKEGEPNLLVWEWLQVDVLESTWIKDVRGYGIPFSPTKVKEMIEEKGLSKARIGAELGLDQRLHMPYNDFQEIVKLLPNVSFIDASDIFWHLRTVKTAEEVETQRKCCEISSRALKRFFEEAHEGMTLEEAYKKLAILHIEEGAVVTPHSWICIVPSREGYATEKTSEGQTPKKLEKGDIVWIDNGVYFKGYWDDFTRVGVVGKPSSEQVEEYEITFKLAEISTAALSPGRTFEEVIKEVVEKATKLGVKYEAFAKHYLGYPFRHIYHGVGMDLVERPYVRVDWKGTIEEGMVLAVEPVRVKYETVGGHNIIRNLAYLEENVVITKNGCQLLSNDKLRFLLYLIQD
jgi:Xaa-Pro dipeptidase